MKKLLVPGIAAAAFCSAPALATDLPTKAPVYKAAAPIFNWTGFYIGGNAGWGTANFKDRWNADPNYWGPGLTPLLDQVGSSTLRANGVVAGGQVGYNYQIQSILLGIESDLDYTGFSKKRDAAFVVVAPNLIHEEASSRWLATVRGRIGVVTGSERLLIYGTGGAAFAKVSFFDSELHTLVPESNTASSSKVRAGWAAGAGLEYAANANWSIKAEYLHADLGSLNYTSVSNVSFAFPPCGACIIHNHHYTTDIGRVGINYRFGQ